MGILKKRFSFWKSACLLLGVLLLAGCTSGHSGETTTTAVGEFRGNGLPLESGTDEEYHLPAPLPRDTWNIELSVVKIEDELITIEVRDNDNLGYRSSSISQLERLNGENWETIRKYDKKLAEANTWDSLPDTELGYTTVHNKFLNPKTPGHYRVTYYLNEKPFSLEFDLPN